MNIIPVCFLAPLSPSTHSKVRWLDDNHFENGQCWVPNLSADSHPHQGSRNSWWWAGISSTPPLRSTETPPAPLLLSSTVNSSTQASYYSDSRLMLWLLLRTLIWQSLWRCVSAWTNDGRRDKRETFQISSVREWSFIWGATWKSYMVTWVFVRPST